jgi:2,4-dienoyl-CoA reductase-like NADH-dependent reductase (Old Yellow Enzyme family)
VEAIHSEGVRAALQLNPSAGKAEEESPIYVSLPKNPLAGAKELSEEDIERIVQ